MEPLSDYFERVLSCAGIQASEAELQSYCRQLRGSGLSNESSVIQASHNGELQARLSAAGFTQELIQAIEADASVHETATFSPPLETDDGVFGSIFNVFACGFW